MFGVRHRRVSRKRVFNPLMLRSPVPKRGCYPRNPSSRAWNPFTKQKKSRASFGQLVFGDSRDENIVAACVKAHGEFVVFAVILALNLVAQERNLKRKVLAVCGATLNELCKVGLFVATKPHSHTATFVVGVNHINDGGFAVFAFNACLVRLNNVACVKGVKFGLDTVTVWINGGSACWCVFCDFCQECFNFVHVFAHFNHFSYFVRFCCLDNVRLLLRLFIG